MSKPAVTVLIPTYNRAQYLPECLDSVLGQTAPPSQVIVINDGSTDNTREILEPYMGKIEYLEKENGGKSTALNLGMSRVTGDYVWIMDDDDVAFPDHLERHLKLLEANKELGFTYSSYTPVRSRPGERAFRVLRPPKTCDVPEEELFLRLMMNNFMSHPGMVVRTVCYRQVGPFNPQLIRCEDYEMALRLARAFRCERVSGPTFYYRLHDGVRGTAAHPITLKTFRQKIQPFYDRIFLPLRKELSLRDYLPRSWDEQKTERLDERRAYLQRMGIMACQDLLEEMLEDLRLALSDGSDCRPLSEAERAILWNAMGTPHRDDVLFAGPEFLRRIRALCQGEVGHQVHFELARGLYWRFLGALRKRDFAFAFQLVRCACWFLGFRRAVAFALERLQSKAASSWRRGN